MTRMSNYLENSIIQHYFRNNGQTSPATVYCALSTADPTESGAGLSEPTGAFYSRQPITFGAPSDGTSDNTNILDFGTSDEGSTLNLTHIAVFDSAVGGNMLMYGPLTTPLSVPNGQPIQVPIGDLDLQFQ